MASNDDMALSGLGNLSDLLADGGSTASTGPQLIPLSDIDEDPNQPRKEGNPGFSDASLKELAETIKARGVKSPISLREGENGRFVINHGARRFRAARMAGKTDIPAFIDNDYSETDQVIENLQRDELTAREIADYIGRQKAAGMNGKQISALIGKSNAWVSQHAALLDLPDCLADAFASGRLRDLTVITELLKLWKKSPEDVESWLADEQGDITRTSVKTFAEFLAEKQAENDGGEGGEEDSGEGDEEPAPTPKLQDEKEPKEADPTKLKKAIVMIEYDERKGRMVLTKRPEVPGGIWIKLDDGGEELEVDASELKVLELIEG